MNPFQAQFPLSPRKFWKKFLPAILPILILGFFVAVFTAFISGIFFENLNPATALANAYIVFFVILILFPIAILSFYTWYYKAYIRSYFYDANDAFITIRKGVFTPKEIHVQYAKIQDVYVDQDLLDRILGLYDVHLASATVTSGIEAHIDGVNKDVAEGLKNFLLSRIRGDAMPPGMQTTSAPSVPTATQTPTPNMQFSEEISSKTYPLAPGWFLNQTVTAFFLGIFFGFVAVIFLVPKDPTQAGVAGLLPGHYIGLFLIVAVGYFIIHSISNLIWNSSYRFEFTPDYILLHTGVLSQSETHLPYRNVQDVTVSLTIIDRIFGMARVSIQSAAIVQTARSGYRGAGINLVGLSKANANHIVDVLKPVLLAQTSTQTGL